ncbi:MAG: hypothetical protein ACQEP6_03255, partial [Patescibacteria group bacterium]
MANMKWYFTRIEKGSTVFINKGDDKKDIWPNVGGFRMSEAEDPEGRRWLIKTYDVEDWEDGFFHNEPMFLKPFQKIIWRRFGIRFMSVFWPQVKRHSFTIDRKQMKEHKKDSPLSERVVQSPNPSTVDSLLFLVPRPIYIEGVELAGDNSKVSLLLLPIFQQV